MSLLRRWLDSSLGEKQRGVEAAEGMRSPAMPLVIALLCPKEVGSIDNTYHPEEQMEPPVIAFMPMHVALVTAFKPRPFSANVIEVHLMDSESEQRPSAVERRQAYHAGETLPVRFSRN